MTLDVVASLVHLKMKYHNVHGEPVTICDDLSIAQKVHNTFHRDPDGKSKDNAMEVNVARLNECLRERDGDQPPRKGVVAFIKYDINYSNSLVAGEDNKCIPKPTMLNPTKTLKDQ